MVYLGLHRRVVVGKLVDELEERRRWSEVGSGAREQSGMDPKIEQRIGQTECKRHYLLELK